MRVLVTGGAGFIGSHLVDRLVSEGSPSETGIQRPTVTVLDNLNRGRLENLAESWSRISFIEGDIRDRDLLESLTAGVDVVYHLAAQSNVLGALSDPDYSFTTNVVGTYEVLRASHRACVQRVVFTSSREVYGDPERTPVPETAPIRPKNAYGASKGAAEMYCRAFAEQGLAITVLRLANVFGSRDRGRVIALFIENALAGRGLVVYGSEKTLDFIWIDRVIDALLRAGTGPFHSGPVNVGSGVGVRLPDLAKRVRSLIPQCGGIQVVANRQAEVDCFVADVSSAKSVYGLEQVADPIDHLSDLVAGARAARLAAAATV